MKRRNLGRRPALAAALAALALSSLPACTYNHWAQSDTIVAEAGDAVAVNRAQQTIDTMPKSARRTALKHDSDRLNKAIERYKDPVIETDTGEEEDDASPSE